MFVRKINKNTILFFILLLAAGFRLYNLNWDSGHFIHPDERAIIMAVEKLKFPNSVSDFFSPLSLWNPNFFAYGSFPMYLLRVIGNVLGSINAQLGTFTSLTLIGRFLSAVSDMLTVWLIYKIANKLFNSPVGLLSSFFYAISVLPIQLSHFFAVDTLLTLLILSTLYSVLNFYEKPSLKTAVLVGLFFGLSLATKISAIVLVVSVGFALFADFILVFLKNPNKPKNWLPHVPSATKHLIRYALTIGASTLFTFLFFEPYALIDFNNFWQQTLEQSELTKNIYYFPYTLQFVGKIPYVYELKNIFLWGLGPILATLSFLGFFKFTYLLFTKERKAQFAKEFIIFIFFVTYFLIVGNFAVGFMRYMLPVYPLFAIFAALLFYQTLQVVNKKNRKFLYFSFLISYLSFLLWPVSFMQIYTRPNTRIQASDWIYKNIPPEKTLAVEHWDDQLPIGPPKASLANGGKPVTHPVTTLKLYDPDSVQKWNELNQQLMISDYIILASNRLYAPLQKLTDCNKLPSFRCYPKTADYYKKLFSGELGFEKVAEFTSYPTVPIFNIPINDQGADENFTVFDHPKVMIFKKKPPSSTM